MGHKNADRVPLSYRRVRCETVAEMQAQGWKVITRCRACRVERRVDLQTRLGGTVSKSACGTARHPAGRGLPGRR